MKIIQGTNTKGERKVYDKNTNNWNNYNNDLSLRENHRVDGQEEKYLIEAKKSKSIKDIKVYDTLAPKIQDDDLPTHNDWRRT